MHEPEGSATLIFGRDARRTRRWAGTVILFVVVSLVYWQLIDVYYPQFHRILWLEGYAVVFVGLSAVQAYTNDGLVMSWAVAAAPILGGILWYVASVPGTAGLGQAFLLGTAVAVALGSAGFAVGAGCYRIVRRMRGS